MNILERLVINFKNGDRRTYPLGVGSYKWEETSYRIVVSRFGECVGIFDLRDIKEYGVMREVFTAKGEKE